jgi:hypothetical protein
MHSEPINTAADLIHGDVIPITSEVRKAYHRILSRSLDRILSSRRKYKAIEVSYLEKSSLLPDVQKRGLPVSAAKAKKKNVANAMQESSPSSSVDCHFPG